MDDLYEIYTSVNVDQKVANKSVAAKKAYDRANAKALWDQQQFFITRKNSSGTRLCVTLVSASGGKQVVPMAMEAVASRQQ